MNDIPESLLNNLNQWQQNEALKILNGIEASFGFEHVASANGEILKLSLAAQNESCPPLNVEIGKSATTVIWGGWHDEFLSSENCSESNGINCVDLVKGIVAGNIKQIITESGGKPYKWSLLEKRDSEWKFISSTSSLFNNYFGKRIRKEILFTAQDN